MVTSNEESYRVLRAKLRPFRNDSTNPINVMREISYLEHRRMRGTSYWDQGWTAFQEHLANVQ